MSDDLFEFLDEENNPPPKTEKEAWRILIVDDDKDVHDATVFSLQDVVVLDKPLEFLHAYSGKDGVELLRHNRDIALILLDAVMETEDAGLVAAQYIREVLGMSEVRIILRTGQPGQVPELDTITKYDINDYKTKNELSRTKLITAIVAALRSWQQIVRIQNSRRGLEKIITASNSLIAEDGLSAFAEGVISQIASLFDLDPDGIVCACSGEHPVDSSEYRVIAAAGSYCTLINKTVAEIDAPAISSAIRRVLQEKRNIVESQSLTLYFHEPAGRDYATWIGSPRPIRALDSNLLEIFCTNLSLCASNIDLVSRLKRQAWEDPVLHIPNLAALLEHIQQKLAGANAEQEIIAVLDISGFNQIVDLLGHQYGDAILQSLVDRLQEKLGGVFLARISADVFAVLGHRNILCPEMFQSLVSLDIETPDGQRELAISIGWSELDPQRVDSSSQLRNSYAALKQAKSEGAGQVVRYSKTIGDNTRERVRLLHELRGGLSGNQLFLAFQPQISIQQGKIFCCEALLRWRNREGKLIAPDQFIPLAEQAGLIMPIGRWVLKMSLLALRQIHDAGFDDFHMAVNVSAIQLRNSEFLRQLDLALAESGVNPRFLELEITESIAVLGAAEVLRLLKSVKDRGVTIAVDDFGTGYSSLSTIDRWPVDRIKIDRSFIHNMDRHAEGARLVDLVIPLANRLGLRVIAEGVENEGQMVRLRQLGCHEAQGFLISKPLDIKDLLPWLHANKNMCSK